jgi:hypothetical protein
MHAAARAAMHRCGQAAGRVPVHGHTPPSGHVASAAAYTSGTSCAWRGREAAALRPYAELAQAAPARSCARPSQRLQAQKCSAAACTYIFISSFFSISMHYSSSHHFISSLTAHTQYTPNFEIFLQRIIRPYDSITGFFTIGKMVISLKYIIWKIIPVVHSRRHTQFIYFIFYIKQYHFTFSIIPLYSPVLI